MIGHESSPQPIGPQLVKEMGVWHTRLFFANQTDRDDFTKEAATPKGLSEDEMLAPITQSEIPGGKSSEYDLWPHDGWKDDEPGQHLTIRRWNGSPEAAEALLRFVMTKRNQPVYEPGVPELTQTRQ